MKNSITILLALFAVTLSSAQVRQWTLQECVEYAVENNLTVEQFELDLENAKIDKSDAVGNMLPSLNGTMSASSNTGFSINPTNNLPTNSTANNVNISATSSITLFDGLRNIN
ncbi:MAG TPA: transporter, partial [Muricauda sp.]|nr:transporter [Allomuricauda sp.]